MKTFEEFYDIIEPGYISEGVKDRYGKSIDSLTLGFSDEGDEDYCSYTYLDDFDGEYEEDELYPAPGIEEIVRDAYDHFYTKGIKIAKTYFYDN